jgi:hypothetical protein
MDYNLSSTLVFKSIFHYDFISVFFIGIQYMIHDGKKNMNWKTLQQKINEQITMDFLIPYLGQNFKSPNVGHFLLDWIFFV